MIEPKDVNEMRQRLQRIARTGRDLDEREPLQFGAATVRAVLLLGEYQGLSGEDTYAMLAWHLLQDVKRLGKMVLDDEMAKPPWAIVLKDKPDADQK